MPAPAPPRRLDGLRLIGLFKLAKAVLLLVMLYGANRLLNPEVTEALHRWGSTLTDSEERSLVMRVLDWIGGLSPKAINNARVVTLAYVGLLGIEGTGLWLRQRWAEWVTVCATASLVPFELWKLVWHTPRHAWLLVLVLAVNCAIVAYLWAFLRRRQRTTTA